MARGWWCVPSSWPPIHLGEPAALGHPTLGQFQARPLPDEHADGVGHKEGVVHGPQ